MKNRSKTIPIRLILIALLCQLLLISCSQENESQVDLAGKSSATLREVFAPFFDFGVAINRNQALGTDAAHKQLVRQHFSVLTAENDMKWEVIQPKEGQFVFKHADALVERAAKNDQKIIGHALVWHSQVPDWVFLDENGNTASRELLLARMEAHINAVAGRYKDQIHGWDVLNEALNEDGSLRDSQWRSIIGDDYIIKAFEFAQKAAPDAQLYYNDYNMFKADKRAGAIKMAQSIRAQGIRIDAIGAQAHYLIDPPLQELEQAIIDVSEAGFDFMVTELDVSVLAFPEFAKFGADVSQDFELQAKYNPYAQGLSQAAYDQQAEAYKALFALFLKYHDAISRVTMWGLTDADTWKNYWPMKGRTDYPLIIDRNNQLKPFMFEIANMVSASNTQRK